MPYLMGAPFPPFLKTSAAGSLANLSWRLPRTGDSEPGVVWFCAAFASQSVVMGGVPGVTYDVTFRFRGVVEKKAYSGGTNDGAYWQVGGTPNNAGTTDATLTGPNLYYLEISDPFQRFYLNRSADSIDVSIVSLDYSKTVQIKTGATVLLYADSVAEILVPHVGEYRELSHSTSVSGITDPTQPYVGQFINAEVTAIVAV